MVTQAFAQEAVTPTEENLDNAIDATHTAPAPGATGHDDPTAGTHATTEAHGDAGHSDVFPPFDPATFPSQLLWLALSFAVLYLLMSKVALPRMGSIIDDRKARIDADIAAAEADQQKTDAAIAAYEAALAEAKNNARAIATAASDASKAELDSKRKAVEADLAGKVTAAEARIATTKAAAMGHVDEIAAETAQTVVTQLVGDIPSDSVRAAVAKASKE
jgi:F-type H+-transporting ATPase subunit b